MNQLASYAIRRLIFIAIAWGIATYVAPHLIF